MYTPNLLFTSTVYEHGHDTRTTAVYTSVAAVVVYTDDDGALTCDYYLVSGTLWYLNVADDLISHDLMISVSQCYSEARLQA